MKTIESMHTWSFQNFTRYAYRPGNDVDAFVQDFSKEYPHFRAEDVQCGFLSQKPVYSPYRRAYVQSWVIDQDPDGQAVVFCKMELPALAIAS